MGCKYADVVCSAKNCEGCSIEQAVQSERDRIVREIRRQTHIHRIAHGVIYDEGHIGDYNGEYENASEKAIEIVKGRENEKV